MTCSIDKNFSLVSITDAKGAHTYRQTIQISHIYIFFTLQKYRNGHRDSDTDRGGQRQMEIFMSARVLFIAFSFIQTHTKQSREKKSIFGCLMDTIIHKSFEIKSAAVRSGNLNPSTSLILLFFFLPQRATHTYTCYGCVELLVT